MKARLLQLFWVVPALLLSLSLTGVAQAAEVAVNDVSSLVVTYHVAPVNRAAFRRELETSGLRQFQRWKNEGILNSYRILFNRYADSDNWDAMAQLTFSSSANVDRWKKLEQTTPAGLPPKALALITSIHTTPVEVARTKRTSEAPINSVFVVIPYVTMVSIGDYLKYADDYVIPQFDGWMAELVLSQYDLLLGSFPAGRPWSAMVILEYKDEEALAKRNEVVAKVRAKLMTNPTWKAVSENKKSVRDEKQVVIADQLSLH